MKYVIDVFNKYDIRGAYPKEINEGFTLTLGKATGTYCRKKFKNKKIAVGMDTRLSSKVLKDNLIKGLLLTGIEVVDIGKATTEKTALAGKHYGCAFSVMITASHHSFNSNGFKFMYNKGNGFSNEDMAKIKEIFLSKKFCKGKGKCADKSLEFDKEYEEKICRALEEYIDVDKLKGVKVVADLCNTFASRHLVNVLEKYKCDVIKVNCRVISNDTSFEPEPQKENRQYIAELIKEKNADIGIGIDPDGDRIFVFDSNGEWIDGNELFCLLSGIMNPKKIVASLDTSSMLEEHTKDAQIFYTKIGDIFVSKKAIEIDADFLGEPNGHFAFPKFCWYNSGTFAGLKLCSIAKKIPYLTKKLPKYHTQTKKREYKNHEEKEKAIKANKEKIKETFEVLSELCGIKFKCNDSVCLVRASGTSPVIRIFVENKNKDQAKEDMKKINRILI